MVRSSRALSKFRSNSRQCSRALSKFRSNSRQCSRAHFQIWLVTDISMSINPRKRRTFLNLSVRLLLLLNFKQFTVNKHGKRSRNYLLWKHRNLATVCWKVFTWSRDFFASNIDEIIIFDWVKIQRTQLWMVLISPTRRRIRVRANTKISNIC